MNAKITDVTAIYIMDDILNLEHYIDRTQYALWYRSNDLPKISNDNDDNNDKSDESVFDIFNNYGFPEYKPIAMHMINYFCDHLLDDNDDDDNNNNNSNRKHHSKKHTIRVLVDDKSIFSKGHYDRKGFVQLFTLEFRMNNDNLVIEHISINAELVTEKIKLGFSNKYPNKFADETSNKTSQKENNETVQKENTDQDKINETDCTICLSNKGNLIKTPCNHLFHLDCLKCTPKMLCPICRTDIKDCLNNNGISNEEISYRLERENKEKEFENFCDAIDEIQIDKMLEIDFVRLCMNALKLNNGDIISYNDIIFDMNANASELFAKISSTKSKKEKGVFMYMYDSPVDFILQMRNPKSPSKAEWAPLSAFIDTPLYDIMENRINRIKNYDEEYVVAILIENVINAHIVHKDAHKDNKFAIRIHQRDILNSIVKCIRCRCSGDCQKSINREYEWANANLNKSARKAKKCISKKKKSVSFYRRLKK